MCNIFPEVEDCCLFFPLRIGMVFISVLAIMTGALTLSIIEKNSDLATLGSLQTLIKNQKGGTATIDEPKEVISLASSIVSSLVFMALAYMALGIILLIATLVGEEGIVQIFVVGMFIVVLFGFVCCLAASYVCMIDDAACIVREMDWLSGSAIILFVIIYLFGWIYFISVANSFVVNGD